MVVIPKRKKRKGIPIFVDIVNYVLLADDITMLAEDKEDLTKMTRELKEEGDMTTF